MNLIQNLYGFDSASLKVPCFHDSNVNSVNSVESVEEYMVILLTKTKYYSRYVIQYWCNMFNMKINILTLIYALNEYIN